MLATIENATNDITGMLHRMRELAVQAINDTNGPEDRSYLQDEVVQLMEEINRVASDTEYNGQTVLDGGFINKVIQVGTQQDQDVDFDINSVSTDTLALSTGGSSDIDLTDAVTAGASLDLISNAIETVAGDRAKYGALQNRLEYTVSNLLNVAEYTTAARSRIADADFAAESARLAKAQVLQQSGTAMLAQANASSQLAVTLIR